MRLNLPFNDAAVPTAGRNCRGTTSATSALSRDTSSAIVRSRLYARAVSSSNVLDLKISENLFLSSRDQAVWARRDGNWLLLFRLFRLFNKIILKLGLHIICKCNYFYIFSTLLWKNRSMTRKSNQSGGKMTIKTATIHQRLGQSSLKILIANMYNLVSKLYVED